MHNYPFRFDCPDLGDDRVPAVYAAIEQWAGSKSLAMLVNHFGSQMPNKYPLPELLSWLLDFSERWDFRKTQQTAVTNDTGESARWLLKSSEIAPEVAQAVYGASSTLGLIGVGEPPRPNYDYVVALGGARLSCLLRSRFAAQLTKRQTIIPIAIVLLSSARPVSESERDATNTYAPAAATEFDLMNKGAELSFELGESKVSDERYEDLENSNRSWAIRTYQSSEIAAPLISISGPSSEPEKRRANSADTYRFFFERMHVPQGASLLLVTSQIYVPYQQLEALRTLALAHQVIVDTVGFPAEWSGAIQGMFEPTNYLQEIRSTIQAANRFVKAYPCTS